MNYKNVESSNISAIAYENNNLYIKFKSNTEYKYINVPNTIYEELINANSKGKYINESIKGKYMYERINK